jgi:hypothetical protein
LGLEKKELSGCYLWEDVFRVLDSVKDEGEVFSQFLEFMKTHGLNPGEPLTLPRIQAYLQSSGFEQSLERAANKLSTDCEWSTVPARFHTHKQVTNRWGRIAVEFATPYWRPTITVGFLVDTKDHKVAFTNPSS